MHDNGERIGITYEECAESLLVVFHMAKELEAELELIEVRLGTVGYSLKLKVSKPADRQHLEMMVDPEMDAIFSGLKVLKKEHVLEYMAQRREQERKVRLEQ